MWHGRWEAAEEAGRGGRREEAGSGGKRESAEGLAPTQAPGEAEWTRGRSTEYGTLHLSNNTVTRKKH